MELARRTSTASSPLRATRSPGCPSPSKSRCSRSCTRRSARQGGARTTVVSPGLCPRRPSTTPSWPLKQSSSPPVPSSELGAGANAQAQAPAVAGDPVRGGAHHEPGPCNVARRTRTSRTAAGVRKPLTRNSGAGGKAKARTAKAIVADPTEAAARQASDRRHRHRQLPKRRHDCSSGTRSLGRAARPRRLPHRPADPAA